MESSAKPDDSVANNPPLSSSLEAEHRWVYETQSLHDMDRSMENYFDDKITWRPIPISTVKSRLVNGADCCQLACWKLQLTFLVQLEAGLRAQSIFIRVRPILACPSSLIFSSLSLAKISNFSISCPGWRKCYVYLSTLSLSFCSMLFFKVATG